MKRPSAWSMTLSSCSAMPMPQTTPPRTWLRAVFGLMMRPAATALTTRVTRTVPKSSSTCTSHEHRRVRGARVLALRVSMSGTSEAVCLELVDAAGRARMSSSGTRRRRLGRVSRMPAVDELDLVELAVGRAASRPSSRASSTRAAARSFSQAPCTAEPTVATVHEPPSTGAIGRVESPSWNVDLLERQARASSAAICVMTV